MKKDILLYMSDQHSYRLQGYAGDQIVRTPNLDRIAASGTVMTRAMTACPLCVPARAAMISGYLPSNNGVLFNFNSIHSDQATFLHSLNAFGYDTVLCGRMHFVGPDQRHGYSRRIAGERTPVFHNGVGPVLRLDGTKSKVTGFDENGSVKYIGSGDSPVLAYDRYVIDHALAYLAEDHEAPQFITVGTYGPHFPYVAPRELYEYYYDKVSLEDVNEEFDGGKALEGKLQEADPDVARAARAAYYGLVEQQDRHIGQVYDAFQNYLKRTGREGIFLYVSDHGDMNGTHGYYGKQVFYDPAVHIPFIISGAGIPKGKKIENPVSLLDVGPTICDLAGATVLSGNGKSLKPQLQEHGETDEERMVVSELYTYLANGKTSLGRMVQWKNWKWFSYSGLESDARLYNTDVDSEELFNVVTQYPEIAEHLKTYAEQYKSYDQVMVHEKWVMEQLKILMKCHYDDPQERWQCPQNLEELETPVCTKKAVGPTLWAVQMFKKLEEK